MHFLTNLFRRPARPAVRRTSLALESLEERQLLSAAPITSAEVLEAARLIEKRVEGLNSLTGVVALLGVVDGAEKPFINNGVVVGLERAVHPATTGKVSGTALIELDTIFSSPSQWGLGMDAVRLGDRVLNSVQAGESVVTMQHTVDAVFGITPPSGSTGNNHGGPGWDQPHNNPF
jgi:hypothetical protein